MWLLIVEVLAAIIAATRGWGILPLPILGGNGILGFIVGACNGLTASTISALTTIDFMIAAILIIMALAGKKQGTSAFRQAQPTEAMKRCPYCTETILAKAIVCKHCGRDLKPQTDE